MSSISYTGLLLSAMFSPAHDPVMLTGAREDDAIGVRQQTDLDRPEPQVFRPYPPLVAGDIQLAAQIAQQLDAMRPDTEPAQLLRLLRTMHIYLKTRTTVELLDRIHQYCRCIDGTNPARYRRDKAAVQEQDAIIHRPDASRPDGRAVRHSK